MKIVDVTEFYSERGGGVRSHLTTRGHFLCQLGHDHVVIAPGPRDADAPEGAGISQNGGTRVVRVGGPPLPYDRTYHLLGRFDKVRALIRAEIPDIVEAHSPYLAAAAIVLSGPARTWVRTAFWHADHVGTYVQPALARRVGAPAASVLSAPLWTGVRAMLAPFEVTFVSGRLQAERLRRAGVRNVLVTPMGVDVGTFHPALRSARRRTELLGYPDDGTALLVGVGRFAFEKRWDVVLDAFARIRASCRARLVLFGDGPERANLERRAPPGVLFAGFETDRTRLASAMASADLLVHGCPYETFGLGVAEAVACGLPVAVPDAGGAPDSADPSCGVTYRSLDVEACASAIERLLSRDRGELRARALDAAARVPTAQQHFARVVSTYEDLRREKGLRRASSLR